MATATKSRRRSRRVAAVPSVVPRITPTEYRPGDVAEVYRVLITHLDGTVEPCGILRGHEINSYLSTYNGLCQSGGNVASVVPLTIAPLWYVQIERNGALAAGEKPVAEYIERERAEYIAYRFNLSALKRSRAVARPYGDGDASYGKPTPADAGDECLCHTEPPRTDLGCLVFATWPKATPVYLARCESSELASAYAEGFAAGVVAMDEILNIDSAAIKTGDASFDAEGGAT
jgi:hypothetical protein